MDRGLRIVINRSDSFGGRERAAHRFLELPSWAMGASGRPETCGCIAGASSPGWSRSPPSLEAGRRVALRPRDQGVDLGVARVHVIEQAIELSHGRAQVVPELIRVEQAGQPLQAD